MRPILITFSSSSKLPSFSCPNFFLHAKTEFHLQVSSRKTFGGQQRLSFFVIFLISFSLFAFYFSLLFWYEKCVRKFNRSYCSFVVAGAVSPHCCNAKFLTHAAPAGMQRAAGSVQQAACNGSVQRATCMRWALPERPHGVCVIIFSAAHCEFCIISIYKLLPRVGKTCTNKGRKNPKKRNLTEAPQTENLISQLISIWTNLELQQIRRGWWRGRCRSDREKAEPAEGEGGTKVGARARVKGPLKRRHLWHSKSFRWGIVRSGCHLPHVEWREIVSQLSSAGGRVFDVVWAWLGLPRVA